MSDGERTLRLRHGELSLPAFLPDATQGVVRSVDAYDLERCGIQAVVMNTFHLMQRPGSSTIKALGGLHAMAGWERPIITDSGGFQAYSLIHQNAKFGRMSEDGITFRPDGSAREFNLTPEKCVQLQLAYDSDVVICLDDCTHADAPLAEQELAVARTIAWARRCKAEFMRQMEERRLPQERRPLLFGVIQGGRVAELRRRCAQALLEIGFDGFGYGGWPLDASNNLLLDIITYTRELVPARFPMHALGVGHPANIVACARLGYGIFDSSMPTRDARHARLYTFTTGAEPADWPDREWLAFVYVGDKKHVKARQPISDECDCATCRRYSLGYLHHLFKIGDSLFFRLATVHNLRFMARLMEKLRICLDGQ
ncbi:MAG: tRNA guanosine(34) transglycosylase Tgt [Ktedonobacterales bacterium]